MMFVLQAVLVPLDFVSKRFQKVVGDMGAAYRVVRATCHTIEHLRWKDVFSAAVKFYSDHDFEEVPKYNDEMFVTWRTRTWKG